MAGAYAELVRAGAIPPGEGGTIRARTDGLSLTGGRTQ